MAKDTLLKQEFQEKDLNRMRNILTKKYGDNTSIQVGYKKEEEEHKEGDIWEENNKTWTIKNGLKQNITKLDSAKKASRMPLVCPKCSGPMNTLQDKRFYPLHKMCFSCVVEMETQLKIEGKYEEYMKDLIKRNVVTHVTEAEEYLDEFSKEVMETYVTEEGDIEDWEGAINKDKLIEEWKKELQELKAKVLS